jgi:hypothetical protein
MHARPLAGRGPEIVRHPATTVSATCARSIAGWPNGLAHLTLFLPGDAVAQVDVSWLAPLKPREITIAVAARTVVYDDQQSVEKLHTHDKGVRFRPFAAGGGASTIVAAA